MKTYIDKQFDDIKEIKRVDLQQLGAYYSIPIKNIYENKRNEFDYEDLEDRVIIDNESLESGEYVEYFDEVEYEYTDEYEIDYTLNYLVNELGISGKNIEKCPSIIYRNVNNIKKNVLFCKISVAKPIFRKVFEE